MAKVIGVGGVFFKCADREKTAAFYSTALGFEIDADSNSAMFRHADVAAAPPAVATHQTPHPATPQSTSTSHSPYHPPHPSHQLQSTPPADH